MGQYTSMRQVRALHTDTKKFLWFDSILSLYFLWDIQKYLNSIMISNLF